MKVYCNDCEFISSVSISKEVPFYISAKCLNKNVKIKKDTFYEEIEIFGRAEIINKGNDCRYFKLRKNLDK
jgi:hypothetical protein